MMEGMRPGTAMMMIISGWAYASLEALCTTAELKVYKEGAHLLSPPYTFSR